MADSSDEHYLTTAEVAARLKVKPETVYAYVSRGLLTSTRARGRRGSLFLEADVDRLVDRTVDHPGAIERIESQITLISDDDLFYRGHRVRDLVSTHTVESVASLLWTGRLASPARFPAPADDVELARRAITVAPAGARLTDKLRIAVAVLGAGDQLRFDLTPQAVTRAAAQLLGVLVAALPGPDHQTESFGADLWPKLSTGSDAPPRPELLDAAVILLADHGLAVSTLAARVAASARANLYAVVSAGLGALDGQLHGAATSVAYDFLRQAQDDPVAAVSSRLRTGQAIPGFGHKLYRRRDPRAELLLELLGDVPATRTVRALAEQVRGFPNSDVAVAAMMHTHGLRPDAGEALFALARIIGWTAHAIEEYAQPALRFRALGIYTGPDAHSN